MLVEKLSHDRGFEVQLAILEASSRDGSSYTYDTVVEMCEKQIAKRLKQTAKRIREDFLAGKPSAMPAKKGSEMSVLPLQWGATEVDDVAEIGKRPPTQSEDKPTPQYPRMIVGKSNTIVGGSRNISESHNPGHTSAKSARRKELRKRGLCFAYNENGCSNGHCSYRHEHLEGDARVE